MRLAGERALVTGSTSGIGRHTALRCAREGARVCVHGRDAERGAARCTSLDACRCQRTRRVLHRSRWPRPIPAADFSPASASSRARSSAPAASACSSPTSAPRSSRWRTPAATTCARWPFPIVDGISLLHWHLNRGKKSIVLDLRTPEGVAAYLELVRGADAVDRGHASRRARAPRARLRRAARGESEDRLLHASPATA